jgi:PAS domain S-box-containing protein
MGDPVPRGAPVPPHRTARTGLRTVSVVLAATIVPVASLLWASVVARTEVEQRAFGGLTATAKATVLHEQQAWDDAVRVAVSAATRPVPINAIGSRDATLARLGVENILATGPFATVRLYDAAGELMATAGLAGFSPTPIGSPTTGPPIFGDPVTVGARTSRQISLPAGGVEILAPGRLVVDIDVTQLLGRPAGLAFGDTGAKVLVTPDGMVVAGSIGVGEPLRASLNRTIAAAGQATTAVVFSPLFQRKSVESYEPIPGQNMGILVLQARSEVMAGADRLVARLRWVAFAVGVVGVLLGASLGTFLARRSRRLATSERQLASSQAESRRRLEQFLDAMPIGVFVATADGRPHYANREAERVLGRGIVPGATPDELAEVYQAFATGTGEPYPSGRMPLFRALNGEASHIDDMELRRPDRTVPIEVWGTPVRDADNSIEFGITAFADVSDRRQAAEEVRFLGAITANMSEGVLLIRADDATVVYANASAETMFGYPAGQLLGRQVRDLMAPDQAEGQTGASIVKGLREEGKWRGEVHNCRGDGTPFWCAVNITILDHPAFGRVWIAVNTDITTHRQAQEAQAALAAIVQASREAILAKTLDGIVTSWNPGAERLFGYTAAEMIGGPIEVLIPVEGEEEESELRARVARGLGVEQYETVRLRRDGSAVHVSTTLSPITGIDGRITGIATLCRDISERKRAEAALLEREEQLAAARDHAMEASRLKSQFLSNTSHEIRTPMTVILGMNELLLDTDLDPTQRRFAEAVSRGCTGLLAIVSDILDFSKIEAGRVELDVSHVELRPMLDEITAAVADVAAAKGLRLTCAWPADLPATLLGDGPRLRQVLLNLVSNAVKFTDAGYVMLRAGRRPGPDTAVRFEVVDSGIGIAPEDKDLLFQPFSQVDGSDTRAHGGTGLGLAICKQLVEAMGGRIGVESSAGSGSTFWFEVPFDNQDARLPSLQGRRLAAGQQPPAQHVEHRDGREHADVLAVAREM